MCLAVPPEAPTALTTTHQNGGGGCIRLNWTNNAINTTSLTIQRSTTSAFTAFVTITPPTTTATTYTDTTGTYGQRYCYRVIASNTVGSTMVTGYPSITAYSTLSSTANALR